MTRSCRLVDIWSELKRVEILTIDQIMRRAPVIPVLVIDRLEDAIPLGQALVEGGLNVIEITLRTDAAFGAIRLMSDALPGAIIGAGTVLNAKALDQALANGARFIVSPGLSQNVVKAAIKSEVPILPGIATASDLMSGLDLGLHHFKFFPAETSGGVGGLQALSAPFSQCRFCPTGGIDANLAPKYLGLKTVLCVGGSWVAPARAIADKDWSLITRLANAASQLPRAAI